MLLFMFGRFSCLAFLYYVCRLSCLVLSCLLRLVVCHGWSSLFMLGIVMIVASLHVWLFLMLGFLSSCFVLSCSFSGVVACPVWSCVRAGSISSCFVFCRAWSAVVNNAWTVVMFGTFGPIIPCLAFGHVWSSSAMACLLLPWLVSSSVMLGAWSCLAVLCHELSSCLVFCLFWSYSVMSGLRFIMFGLLSEILPSKCFGQ